MNSAQLKKKILITLPCLKEDPGGVANYYNSVLPHMYKSNQFKIELFELGSTHGEKKFLHQIMDQINYILKLQSVKPDIVHLNPSLNFKSFIREGLILFWTKNKKIQTIVFFRGWETKFEKKVNKIFRLFFIFTYKRSDVFIVLASEFRQKLHFWGIKKPVFLFTTAVNEDLIKKFSIKEKLEQIKQSKNIRILFLSRLEKQKGVFETIDAFQLLLETNHNVTLTIAGDGSVTKELHTYISKKGLTDKIFMPGYVRGNDKIEIFSKHDIYCFPTYYGEGMPNSVLEAMAFGLAVITTPVGGIKDFFENRKMGYLCQTSHPEEIAGMIKKFIYCKDQLIKVGLYNHVYAKKHFMASVAAQNLLDIYDLKQNTQ